MKILNGEWPILILVLMFLVLPLSTIPGMFDLVFVVLGIFALVIAVFIVASLVAALRQRRSDAPAGDA